MRKVTKTVVAAFLAGKPAKVGDTSTDGKTLTLHGNAIAWKEDEGFITMTMAGWPTVTTRERLNGVCQLAINKRPFGQENYVQTFNNRAIADTDTVSIFMVGGN